jgi:K+-transporting ATPase ATPase C chain
MLKKVRTAITLLIIFTALTGILYPIAVTGIARVLFPHKTNGSLITTRTKLLGSELIGQSFTDPRYFWSRLSATTPLPYNGGASTGSNYGPTNPSLVTSARTRIQQLHDVDRPNARSIPVDLVTSSASGLDPHISVAAALYQVPRVARLRGIREDEVQALVSRFTEKRFLGLLGEQRVNVLKLNLALDHLIDPGKE